MPNPKSGTVTLEVGKAVKEVKAGKIDFKIDKQGIIHVGIGKASFPADKIRDNAAEMINTVAKLKPASAKGAYFRSITISTTMSPGVAVDTNSIAGN
jgi:large subunit ribosomal protein L1